MFCIRGYYIMLFDLLIEDIDLGIKEGSDSVLFFYYI